MRQGRERTSGGRRAIFGLLISSPGMIRALSMGPRPRAALAPMVGRSRLSSPWRFRSSVALSPSSDFDYDVVVIGGGHAGCEAAAASARMGARTALVTQRLDTVGELSCNPSIGGIGKGHLVRELDALEGVMGTVADEAGCHYRVLNRRKGPAVRGPRAQMDRDLYKGAMQDLLLSGTGAYGSEEASKYPLQLVEGSVEDLLLEHCRSLDTPVESLAPWGDAEQSDHSAVGEAAAAAATNNLKSRRIRGVVLQDGRELTSRCVVVTTGTFLRGVLMIGDQRISGGRHLRDSEQVEPPSTGLAHTFLNTLNFDLGRLKTGTPPRLDGRTINWDVCSRQPTENPAVPFSHLLHFNGQQPPLLAAGRVISCYQTSTNHRTHDLVSKYAHLLPQYDGMDGAGNGPRYCPSIYKKVERFPDRQSHNCFLEPEGLNTDVVYPNGMSGPYPEEIQLQIMRSMHGLEEVEIVRPGYDVEYDFVNPQKCLTHTLETKSVSGLYLAGQICGTTGYEEAASQGVVAGANAGSAAFAASAGEKPPRPFLLGRDESYIGVLIDDLVTKGTSEPYRMFTSRAEYRISLRADNADLRLTQRGADFGLVNDEERIAAVEARSAMIESRLDSMKHFSLSIPEWGERGGQELMGGATAHQKKGQRKTAEEVLIMPHVTLADVERIMIEVQKERDESEDKEVDDALEDSIARKKSHVPPITDPSPSSIYDTVEAAVKYQSYVVRQSRDMESWRKAQGLCIPPDISYDRTTLPPLSSEELEKLAQHRPHTFADASQISGVTPQSLVYLYHHVLRQKKQQKILTNKGRKRMVTTKNGSEEEGQ